MRGSQVMRGVSGSSLLVGGSCSPRAGTSRVAAAVLPVGMLTSATVFRFVLSHALCWIRHAVRAWAEPGDARQEPRGQCVPRRSLGTRRTCFLRCTPRVSPLGSGIRQRGLRNSATWAQVFGKLGSGIRQAGLRNSATSAQEFGNAWFHWPVKTN